MRWLFALVAGLFGAVAVEAQTALTVPRTVIDARMRGGVTRYRLVPEGRAQPDTTAWTVEWRRLKSADEPFAVQVMIATSHGETTIDSLLFNYRTLTPVWEHVHGADSQAVEFSTSRITGRSGLRRIDIATPGVAYSSTMDNIVIQCLALAAGYHVVLPFWDGDHLEMDTVRVRPPGTRQGNGASAWVVDFVEPYATETLWIDRTSRRVLRHVYTSTRDGTRSIVLVSSGVGHS